MERKLALSFNLLMYEDGSVSPESLEMMKYDTNNLSAENKISQKSEDWSQKLGVEQKDCCSGANLQISGFGVTTY